MSDPAIEPCQHLIDGDDETGLLTAKRKHEILYLITIDIQIVIDISIAL